MVDDLSSAGGSAKRAMTGDQQVSGSEGFRFAAQIGEARKFDLNGVQHLGGVALATGHAADVGAVNPQLASDA